MILKIQNFCEKNKERPDGLESQRRVERDLFVTEILNF